MKNSKRFLAFCLTLILVLTLPVRVEAVDVEGKANLENVENVDNMQEGENTEGVENTEQGIDEQAEPTEASDITNVAVSDSSAIEYIYVENNALVGGDTQNIVLAFSDESISISEAQLVLRNEETGESLTLNANNILNNTILFQYTFDENQKGTYRIFDFQYKKTDTEEQCAVELSDVQKTSFSVGENPDNTSALAEEEAMAVTAYAFDQNGEMVEVTGDSVEQTVESAMTEAGLQSQNDMKANYFRSRSVETRSGELVIALDPGHDTHCGGASANGLVEQDLTLKVANYCKEELERYPNVRVIMTRTGAECPNPLPGKYTSAKDILQRVDKAKEQGADVIVSFHFNSATVSGANGVEIIYQNKSYDANIGQESEELAKKIYEQLVALGLNGRDIYSKDANTDGGYVPQKDANGLTEDYFTLHNEAKVVGLPAVLIEHAFLTGSNDAAFLKNESNLKKLGIADAKGIIENYGLTLGAKLSIVQKNDFEGTFTIQASGVSATSSKKVLAAVWSEVNGQDDLRWYELNKSSDGNYRASVDIDNHKNSLGNYVVDLYYLDSANGYSNCLARTSTNMVNPVVTTEVKQTAVNSGVYATKVNIQNAPTGLQEVQFAIWSAQNGQDDLKFWTAEKNSESVWTHSIKISDYKRYGVYYIDTYAKMSDGSLICLGRDSISVAKPNVGTMQIENYDKSKGVFTVKITGIQADAGISQLQIPVWCNNSQDDLKWYTPDRQSDGSYKVVVDIRNHLYSTGQYKMQVYLTDMAGTLVTSGFMTQNVETLDIVIKADISQQSNAILSASNVGMYGNVKSLTFAVWSVKGGQDDLKWYPASQNASGTWTANVLISNHKTSGEYIVHVYITLPGGTEKFVGGTGFEVKDAEIDSLKIENYNGDAGTFDVVLKMKNEGAGVAGVSFPVWCDSAQSDLVWYTPQKVAEGVYKQTVSIHNHKYSTGQYKAQAYITSTAGVLTMSGFLTQNVKAPEVAISAKANDGNQSIYQLYAGNIGVYGNIKGVSFAVWSEKDGQDDLNWYGGSQNAQGIWTSQVDVTRHKTAGLYFVHVYATLADGSLKFVGGTTFEVEKVSIKNFEFANYNKNAGTVDVVLTMQETASGVKEVIIPVWCDDRQSDLRWYTARNAGKGIYKVSISIKDHKFYTGLYKAQAYITSAIGEQVLSSYAMQSVVLPEIGIQVKNSKDTNVDLTASNVGWYGNIHNLVFAVWSLNNGQDDLKWYEASQSTTGTWQSSLKIANHKTAGDYAVHVYATLENGEQKLIGMSGFTIEQPVISEVSSQNYNTVTGGFTVVISGVKSPSGVNKIAVPVWCADNQSDIYWYEATKVDDTKYIVNVDPLLHKNHSGVYKVQVLLYAGNEINVLAGTTSQIVHAPDLYPIMGMAHITVDQMVKYFNTGNKTYDVFSKYNDQYNGILKAKGADDISTFCKMYKEEAEAEGVRADVAFVQAMLETDFLKFGGDVKPDQCNFAGMGATGNGVAGNVYPDVRTGIRAQIQHLKCYASNEALNQEKVDQRWSDTLRNKAPYVQWLGIPANPYQSGWAADKEYGTKLLKMLDVLKNI